MAAIGYFEYGLVQLNLLAFKEELKLDVLALLLDELLQVLLGKFAVMLLVFLLHLIF